MAEKRMFSQKIINSDAFLDMPLSTQALYFHLAMRADDDGFVNNPKTIRRMLGASAEELSLLIDKRFLIAFEDGIVVIKHWKIHNTIQKDRYKPTQYKDLLELLEVKINKSYTEKSGICEAETECIQNVSKTDTQIRLDKSSIDKIREDKISIEGENEKFLPLSPTLPQIENYIKVNNLNVDAEKFFNYYNDRNWTTAKGNNVEWKKKLSEWHENETKSPQIKDSGNNPFFNLIKNNE